MPRILILTTSYLPLLGGSEIAISEIAKRLPDFSFDIVTGRLDLHAPAYERRGNVTIHRVGGWFAQTHIFLPKIFLPLVLLIKAGQLMIKRSYAIVHAYQASQAAGAGVLLSFFFRTVPIILTLQEGKDLSRQSVFIQTIRKWMMTHVDYCTTISHYLEQYVRREAPRLSVEVIPNGVDVGLFGKRITLVEWERIRSHWGVRENEKVVISISRLVEKNGLYDLIRGVAKVTHPIRLVLVGSGPLRDDLLGLARQQGIAERVIFWGTSQPEILPALLQSADIFARPSLSEGLGNAFLEAMASSLPVIGTPVGGIPDFLIDGQTGALCTPGDPDDIARVLAYLIEHPEYALKIAGQGFEFVSKNYTWDKIAGLMRTVYTRYVTP